MPSKPLPIDASDAFAAASYDMLHCATTIAGLEATLRLRGWRDHRVSVLCRELLVWAGHMQRASMRYMGEEMTGER